MDLTDIPTWAGAGGIFLAHTLLITRPMFRLWRICESDKTKLQGRVDALEERLTRVENGGSNE